MSASSALPCLLAGSLALLLPSAVSAEALPQLVQRHLRSAMPGSEVEILDPLTLELQAEGLEATLSLEGLARACEGGQKACDDALARYVASVVSSVDRLARPRSAAVEDLRATLKNGEFLRLVEEQAATGPPEARAANRLVTRPFAGDLHVVYVLDRPDAMELVLQSTSEELGLVADELHGRALRNLEDAVPPITVEPLSGQRGIHQLVGGDSYDAARLLLHARWRDLAKERRGRLVVAVPSRDRVLLADGGKPRALEALRVLAALLFEQAAYPLTPDLLRWTETGWEGVGE